MINILLAIPTALAQGTAEKVASETENQITSLVTFIVGQVPLWITAIIVIIASFVVARLVRSGVENKMSAEGFEEEHKEIQIVVGRTANAAVLLIGITIALKIAGLDLTPIIAAGAFGMGFALQDLIMNFIAGVMILSARHYTIGDVIKVNGTIGKIIEIQTRATVLKAFDGTKIVVPNADLFKNQVVSLTSNPFRRLQVVTGVAYGSDLKKSMEVILNAIKNTQGVLVEPKPSIFLYEFGDYSINMKCNAWVETKSGWIKTKNRIMINIDRALDEAGIEIPYPIQTIYLAKEEGKEEAQLEQMITEKAHPAPAMAPKTGVNPEYMEAPAWLKKTAEQLVQPQPQPELAPAPAAAVTGPATVPAAPGAVPASQEPALAAAPAPVATEGPAPTPASPATENPLYFTPSAPATEQPPPK